MYAATIVAVLVGAIISTASAVVLESQESGWIDDDSIKECAVIETKLKFKELRRVVGVIYSNA